MKVRSQILLDPNPMYGSNGGVLPQAPPQPVNPATLPYANQGFALAPSAPPSYANPNGYPGLAPAPQYQPVQQQAPPITNPFSAQVGQPLVPQSLSQYNPYAVAPAQPQYPVPPVYPFTATPTQIAPGSPQSLPQAPVIQNPFAAPQTQQTANPAQQPGVPPVPPAVAPPAVDPLGQQAPPQVVQVPFNQYQQMQQRELLFAQMQAEQQIQVRAAQDRENVALIAKGQAEQAIQNVRAQAEAETNAERQNRLQVEDRAKNFALRAELGTILSNYGLTPGSAAQLTALLAPHLQVHAEGNGYVVRTQAFQPAQDFIRHVLSTPEFAKFLAPTTQGGSGATGFGIAPPAPQGTQQPQTWEGGIIQRFQQNVLAAQSDPNAIYGRSFGLGQNRVQFNK